MYCCDAQRGFTLMNGGQEYYSEYVGSGPSIYLWRSKHPVDVWILTKSKSVYIL